MSLADKLSMLRCLAAVLLCASLAAPAGAVIIALGDGSGNTSAPPDDPGWDYVGLSGGLSAVYLGNGWVISANHVPIGDVTLDGVIYPYVPDSKIRIGGADLAVWQLDPAPSWPLLPISSEPDISGEPVIMAGNGFDRGASTNMCAPARGHLWAATQSKRWGENTVVGYLPNIQGTDSFYTSYDRFGLKDEAQVATGDSGGGVFVKNGGEWQLAGVLTLRSSFLCQTEGSAVHGNESYAADLAAYRDTIVGIVRPQCADEVDNDGDLLVDFPEEPDCTSELADDEAPPKVPSISPPGLVALAVALLIAGARGRRRARG